MSGTKHTKTDRELFAEALRLFDRPEEDLHDQPLPPDADVDEFVEAVFGNMTIPPSCRTRYGSGVMTRSS